MEFWDVLNEKTPEIDTYNPLLPDQSGTYKSSKSNHDKVIENVVSVLLDGNNIAINSIQGRQSIEVMQAAYLSALNKEEIKLPLIKSHYKFKLNEQPPITGNKKSI